jgi:SGNH hydrolase-like domain, acetyltransferase AlgX
VLVWSLALVQFLTIQPSRPFSLPTPLSSTHLALIAVFLATSLGFLRRPPRTVLVAAHILVVATLLALHPMTAFGRDGTAVVLMLWLVLAVGALPIRREWVLATASTCLTLLAVETLLSLGSEPRPGNQPDYGSVMGPYGDCGFLRPNLNLDVVGEDGPARFVTNSLGLRREGEVDVDGPASARRVLFVGDSFVAGYRTDQADTVAAQLERALGQVDGRPVEVLAAGAGYPGAAVEIVRKCGERLRPEQVLIGVTLGNDLAQSWFETRGLPQDALDSLLLPADASRSALGLLPMRVRDSLGAWRIFRRLQLAWSAEVMRPWYAEAPRAIHIFDPGHSIGLFYTRHDLAVVDEACADLFRSLEDVAREAKRNGAGLTVVILPQRFQMTEREWSATLFAYGLDPAAFDINAPNSRLLSGCATRHLDCVDLLPALREAAQTDVLYQRAGDMHWNRRGQAVAAGVLADRLRRALAAVR